MPQKGKEIEEAVRKSISELISEGDVLLSEGFLVLSKNGEDIAKQAKADYELSRDKFKQSIHSRARQKCSDDKLAKNVCNVAVNYLEEASKNRGLKVAQQLVDTGGSESKARTVAIIQGAKHELHKAKNREAAIAAMKCIWGVLRVS